MGVWFVLTAVAVAAFGITPGMAVLGIRVASLRSTLVGVPRAVLRTALLALVLPALVRDADGRGWHDRAAPRSSSAPGADAGTRPASRRAGQRRRTVRWTLRIFAPAGSGPLGRAAAREPSAARRPSSVSISAGGDVARQLHEVALQLAQRDLALVVADDDVVDRGLAHHPGVALLLLREQALDAVRGALGDQDDARPADHAVHGVEVRGARDARGDPPRAPHVLQRPARGARLALGLGVHRPLHPPAEDAHRRQHTDRDADRQHQPVHVEDQPDAEDHAGRRPGRPRPSAGRASCPRAAGS